MITGGNVVCPGQTITLQVSAPIGATLRWNTGATTPPLTVSQPGQYIVLVTAAGGCTTSATHLVQAGSTAPVFSLGTDTTVCGVVQRTLRGPVGEGLTYVWSDNSLAPTLTVAAPGQYGLIVRGTCGPAQQAQIRINAISSKLTLPNIITPEVPDGKNDVFRLDAACGHPWEVHIYNRWGAAVFSSSAYADDWSGSALSEGLYYYTVISTSTRHHYRGWLRVVR